MPIPGANACWDFSTRALMGKIIKQILFGGLLAIASPAIFVLLNTYCPPDSSVWWINGAISALVFIGIALLKYATHTGRWFSMGTLMLTTGWIIYSLRDDPNVVLICLIALTLGLIFLWSQSSFQPQGETKPSDYWNQIFHYPGRFLVATFLVLCLVGGLILSLPVCAAKPSGIGFLDALFTSVSATCVTGLIVLDTPVDFSTTGQVVVLLLIQVGGLGIMTFYAAAALLLRQRMSIREEGAAAELLGSKGRSGLFAALRSIFIVTFVAEIIGALLLAWLFWHEGDGILQALWRGLFTSVSAYCNAGFALQSDNLIPYQTQPVILHMIALLIITGGLGPAVVVLLPNFVAQKRVPLHVHLVLSTTVFLLIVPAILFAAIEWSNTLVHLTVWQRLSNAFFQSVTTRTAGFNSIDLAAAHPATLAIMDILMFIGGSPGSTAGGIKTTTAALLFFSVIATLRNRSEVTAFGWRIPQESIYKTITIFVLSLLGVAGGLIALLLTQPLSFHVALFEVLSALGTVGLSIGATGALDGIGKIVIMLCMFAGRVGMLTLLLSLSERHTTSWKLPEQNVIVG